MSNRVHILNEVKETYPTGEALCFQRVVYLYDKVAEVDPGFRFMWRNKLKNLKVQRGGACIETLQVARKLIDEMEKQLGLCTGKV